MAFQLEATTTVQQVLFFRFKSGDATLKHFSGAVSINDTVLSAVAGQIAARVEDFTRGYINAIPDDLSP